MPGPQPITWAEIGNYNREMEIHFTLWEKQMIRHVDEKVIPVIGKNLQRRLKNRAAGKEDEPAVFKAADTDGIKGLFRGMGGLFKKKEQ